MPTEGTDGAQLDCIDCTSLAKPTMVPNAVATDSGVSPAPSTYQQSTDGSPGPVTSPDNSGQVETSRMESIRHQLSTDGISEETSELLLAGWSKHTNSAYQSGWKRWSSWCQGRKIDPIHCGIQPFLTFLTALFQEGLQYSSINTVRSAVSSTHQPIDGVPIGQHPLVRRLFKGVYNSRPPQPCYTRTWDVSLVVDYISQMGENKDLSLKDLSSKLLTLMALTSASRVSELQALDLRFHYYKPNGVLFKLATLTKKRQLGASLKELFFTSFSEDDNLCVVQCLKHYESRTESFRVVSPDQASPLFLSHIQPHKPVTAQRLAHWIKDLLKAAGIDTKVFKAHSVRGASTSAAMDKGVPLSDILSTADWSRDTTFKRFYYRPSMDDTFATNVLRKASS